MKNKQVNVLVFAGGSGSRMNSHARPKQFLQLYGTILSACSTL